MPRTKEELEKLPVFVPIAFQPSKEIGALVPVWMTLPLPDGESEVWLGEDGFPYTHTTINGIEYKVRIVPMVQQPTQKIITKPN